MEQEITNIQLDNDLDESKSIDGKLIIFRSGNVLQGEKKYPFVVTVTRGENRDVEKVEIDWLIAEPDNLQTIQIQITKIFNF